MIAMSMEFDPRKESGEQDDDKHAILNLYQIDALCAHTAVKRFFEICGINFPDPQESLSLTKVLIIAWSLHIRALVILSIVLSLYLTAIAFLKINPAYMVEFFIFFLQWIALIPVLYYRVYRKFDNKEDVLHVMGMDYQPLLKTAQMLLVFFTFLWALAVFSMYNSYGYESSWRVFYVFQVLQMYPMSYFQAFICFIVGMELLKCKQDILKLVQSAKDRRITIEEYKRTKDMVDSSSNRHFWAFGVFMLIGLLNALAFVTMLFLNSSLNARQLSEAVVIGLCGYGREAIAMIVILFYVVDVNETSLELTDALEEDSWGNQYKLDVNRVTILLQQHRKPIVFRVCGIAIYRNDLLLKVVGYLISLTLGIVKSVTQM